MRFDVRLYVVVVIAVTLRLLALGAQRLKPPEIVGISALDLVQAMLLQRNCILHAIRAKGLTQLVPRLLDRHLGVMEPVGTKPQRREVIGSKRVLLIHRHVGKKLALDLALLRLIRARTLRPITGRGMIRVLACIGNSSKRIHLRICHRSLKHINLLNI